MQTIELIASVAREYWDRIDQTTRKVSIQILHECLQGERKPVHIMRTYLPSARIKLLGVLVECRVQMNGAQNWQDFPASWDHIPCQNKKSITVYEYDQEAPHTSM